MPPLLHILLFHLSLVRQVWKKGEEIVTTVGKKDDNSEDKTYKAPILREVLFLALDTQSKYNDTFFGKAEGVEW